MIGKCEYVLGNTSADLDSVLGAVLFAKMLNQID